MTDQATLEPGMKVRYEDDNIQLDGKIVKVDGIESYVDFGRSCMWVTNNCLTEIK